MVHDSIDVERCIWDLEYRDKVRRAIDKSGKADTPAANQNLKDKGTAKRPSELRGPS